MTSEAARLQFELLHDAAPGGRKTFTWRVSSVAKRVYLGTIGFCPQWRAYVFYPTPGVLLDAKCLDTIADFCRRESARWRVGLVSKGEKRE